MFAKVAPRQIPPTLGYNSQNRAEKDRCGASDASLDECGRTLTRGRTPTAPDGVRFLRAHPFDWRFDGPLALHSRDTAQLILNFLLFLSGGNLGSLTVPVPHGSHSTDSTTSTRSRIVVTPSPPPRLSSCRFLVSDGADG